MQRVAPCRFRCGNYRLDIEIGSRASPLDLKRLVRGPDVQRQRIVRRMDRDGGKAGFTGGAGDANGDLATVGDQ